MLAWNVSGARFLAVQPHSPPLLRSHFSHGNQCCHEGRWQVPGHAEGVAGLCRPPVSIYTHTLASPRLSPPLLTNPLPHPFHFPTPLRGSPFAFCASCATGCVYAPWSAAFAWSAVRSPSKLEAGPRGRGRGVLGSIAERRRPGRGLGAPTCIPRGGGRAGVEA